MGFEHQWRTKQGKRSDDNWDFCGIGLRSDASLCIVLDGSTSGANSGELARQIATNLIDWFVKVTGPRTADAIIDHMRETHKTLTPTFRSDSASYVIILMETEKPILVLHAGDCLAGLHQRGFPVCWQTQPHTLANAIENLPIADIVQSPLRNRLTRSFRMREFMRPEVCSINLEGDDSIVVGTDGFWADLDSNDQIQFLDGEDLKKKVGQDDCSALKITTLAAPQGSKVSGQTSENIYIIDTR